MDDYFEYLYDLIIKHEETTFKKEKSDFIGFDLENKKIRYPL